MVNWFRSLMFNIVMFSWITILVVFAWLLIPFPSRIMQGMFRKWAHVAIWAMRIFGGIDVRFIGLDKIPKGPALIASKHQSIWDTFIMYVLLDDPQYILKQELMRIPFWGWSAQKSEHIPIDREAGAKALRDMVDACVDRLSKGRQVIIFPQGTRTAPGEDCRYHPGVAALYQKLPDDVMVVPMALNSGVYWGRRKFAIKPGTITLEVLDPIPPGLPRREFMQKLEDGIETASTRLLQTP